MMKNLLAADINLRPQGDFANLGNLEIPQIIKGLIQGAMVVAAIVFFFMLVIGGIKWIMSGGDKAKTEDARNQITSALIGLVIVFAAWAIIQLISTFFGGLNILDLKLPTVT
jgi:hypothetical protein